MSKQYKVYRETNYIRVIDTTTNELFNGTVKDVFVDKSNTQKNIYRLFNVKDLAEDTVFSIPDILKANGSAYSVSEWEAFYTENTGNFNGGGTAPTNLSYTPSPTQGTVTSDTGTDATIPLADGTNAGLLKPTKFTVLENTSGVNTGDQDLSGKANINSPSFTGTPTATTATVGTNTTQIATTAFVLANAPVTPNATTSVKGIVQLAGDLGGTADAPTVPGLANKVDKVAGKSLIADAEITRLTTLSNYTHPTNHSPSVITQDASNRFVTDAEKTAWNAKQSAIGYTTENIANKQNSLAVDGSNIKYPTVTAVNAGLALKSNDNAVVHLAGTETITGLKTFSANLIVQADITALTNFKSSSSNIILSDNAGTVFRGTRANAWSDNLNARFFQVGSVGDNIVFTTQSAAKANRFMFYANKTQVSSGNYTTTIAPLGIFEVTNGTSRFFNVFESGNSVFGGGTDDSTNKIQVAGTVSSGTTTAGNTPPTANNQLTRKDYVDTGLATKVTSTGTANYIQKSTGTGTQGNSSIIDNGSSLSTSLPIYANSFIKSSGSTNILLAGGGDIAQSDLPIGSITQAALDSKINVSEKGAINGVATLGSDGKVPNSQIPALAISGTFPVSSQAQMLALSQADQGDVAIRSDISKSFILRVLPSSVLGNWSELLTPTGAVTSVNGQVGVVTLSKSDVGLSNVDDTSDANKPVSTAQQTALNLKENTFSKNTAFNKNFGITAGTVVEGGTLGTLAYKPASDYFGYKGNVNNAGNYDDYQENGTYFIQTGNFGNGVNNPPFGNNYGLLVVEDGELWKKQTASVHGNNYTTSRMYYNETWSPWIEEYTSNPNSLLRLKVDLGLGSNAYSSTDYLPLSGGTLSGAISGTSATFSSSVEATQYKIYDLNTAPTSATAIGATGEIRITAGFIYVCTATNTWVRTALATW